MNIEDIASESDLRDWLRTNIHYCNGRLKLDWVEPSIYGSTVGQSDVNIISGYEKIGVELKYLLTTRKGIKWTLRPAQRRYHHMHMKKGGKSALLAYIPAEGDLRLVRGDKIPLRNYISDPGSGYENEMWESTIAALSWKVNMFSVRPDENAILQMERYLFDHANFWEEYE
jgi:hypothetical protein